MGCRRRGTPDRWTRIAGAAGGPLAIGRTAPGRGAWLCSPECFDRALRKGALARALRREASSPEAQALRARLDSNIFSETM